ncbi:MAG: glycosyltransferase [Saprospiraceae bacterium]
MRFVILGTAHPFRGGLAAFNERLAEALIEGGHEVEVVTFTLQYPNFLFPGESQTDDRPAPAGYTITQKLNSVNPLSYYSTGRYIKSLNPDVIICKFWLPFMGPALGTVLRVARQNHTRVFSIIDNIVPHESRPGDRIFAKYFTKAVDHFVVMSRSVEQEMKEFTKPKQQVIFHSHPVYDNFGEPVARELAVKHLGLDPGTRYLLFFGFIRDYKGLDLLLDAMNDDRFSESSKIKLIVAGEYYGNREAYETQIEKLGIADRLELHTDFIANDEVRYYFGAADLVVQPYKTATQSGISQMAYHFGTPMVVTKVGGLPEIVPDGKAGYVVDTTPIAIADAIDRYFKEADQATFRQNVEDLAKQYAWPALVEVLEGLVKR